jgi:hypothetical protein
MDTTELKVNQSNMSIYMPQPISLFCYSNRKVADGSQLLLKGALTVSNIYSNEMSGMRVNWV